MVSLRFAHFWGVVSKVSEVSAFLDEFLNNVRKCNDIYKLQFMDMQSNENSMSSQSRLTSNLHQEIKRIMSKILRLVLKIFYRMSVMRESEDNFMSVAFY